MPSECCCQPEKNESWWMLDKTLLEKKNPWINSQTISGSQVKTKYIKFFRSSLGFGKKNWTRAFKGLMLKKPSKAWCWRSLQRLLSKLLKPQIFQSFHTSSQHFLLHKEFATSLLSSQGHLPHQQACSRSAGYLPGFAAWASCMGLQPALPASTQQVPC